MGQDSANLGNQPGANITVNNYAENAHNYYYCKVYFTGTEQMNKEKTSVSGELHSDGKQGGCSPHEEENLVQEDDEVKVSPEEARRRIINEVLACGAATPADAEETVEIIKCCKTATSLAAVAVGTLTGTFGVPREIIKSQDFIQCLQALTGLRKGSGGSKKNIQSQIRTRLDLLDRQKKKTVPMTLGQKRKPTAAV